MESCWAVEVAEWKSGCPPSWKDWVTRKQLKSDHRRTNLNGVASDKRAQLGRMRHGADPQGTACVASDEGCVALSVYGLIRKPTC